MGNGITVIHCNFALSHQVQLAKELQAGLTIKGYDAVISDSPKTCGHYHVCMGPHFALERLRNARTLYIDRAYWNDPDCVSIHWLRNGEKSYTRDRTKRSHPKLKPQKSGSKTLYLADYGERPDGNYDTIRYHPADKANDRTLQQDLKIHDIAHGRRSTSLVTAAIEGLQIVTDDTHSPVYGIVDRKQWITDLAWHNWSRAEIVSGEFIDGIGHFNGSD